MKYMIMIYSSEQAWNALPEEKQHQIFGEYGAYTEEMKRAGVLCGGEALQPSTTATTVRNSEGRTIHVDGPFVETKEQLGGFWIVECADLDAALAWAAKIPEVVHGMGSAEVRPVMVF
ncbi:YciI family protein [Nannocystis sp. SCPEA4]|uniref:YciI family protein n=1 Tax=Nannocystis sp. SCPEA4 TaxID=2996787 RepID=UPI002271DE79|nr:YciI family protein [Nannocystis sp. SCPEA4]MCY1056242.1 YciI family protein [Nannocystis sp. SCPEA4]